jgi:ferredoxin
MKSIAVFYFSGTGNTELVAKMVKESFEQQQYAVDLVRMEDVLKQKMTINVEKYDFIGIGSQVIGYNAPGIVYDFVRSLPQGGGKKVCIFRTAGGVAPINYNVSKPLMRKLSRKGYEVTYERIFSIGSNWIVRFKDEVMQKLVETTRQKVERMCREVLAGEKRMLHTGLGLRLAMEMLMAIDLPVFRLIAKDYRVEQSCTHCGLCVRQCPVNNIVEKNGKIDFNWSCNGCMRCVYACPQNAIQFKHLTFFPVEGGYNLKKILQHPQGEAENAARRTPPFLAEYIANDGL